MKSEFARQLNIDEDNKTIIFERNGLIFLFNWHVNNSIMNYNFPVLEEGSYKIILNSDRVLFGGHGRIDEKIAYETVLNKETGQNALSVYNTNRTALVFKKVT